MSDDSVFSQGDLRRFYTSVNSYLFEFLFGLNLDMLERKIAIQNGDKTYQPDAIGKLDGVRQAIENLCSQISAESMEGKSYLTPAHRLWVIRQIAEAPESSYLRIGYVFLEKALLRFESNVERKALGI